MNVSSMIVRLKIPAVWGIFLLVVFFLIVPIVYAISIIFRLDPSALGIAVLGGIISGIILVIFDIIFVRGLEAEEIENIERMKIVVQDAINSREVRQVIKEETEKAIILYKDHK